MLQKNCTATKLTCILIFLTGNEDSVSIRGLFRYFLELRLFSPILSSFLLQKAVPNCDNYSTHPMLSSTS